MGSNVRRQPGRRPVSAVHADRDAWRGRLREECLQRVKQQRDGLLRQLRQVGAGSGGADMQQMLAGIIADVSRGSAAPADVTAHGLSPSPAGVQGDIEMDSMQPATGPAPCWQGPEACSSLRSAAAQQPPGAWNDGTSRQAALCALQTQQQRRVREGLVVTNNKDGGASCQPGTEEYAALMLELERSLFEGMLADEAQYLAQLEAMEESKDIAVLVGHMMDALEEGPSGAGRVPCPLCREGRLTERHGVVLCSRGDLRLDLRAEGLTLDDVRQRLANVLEAHGLQGCRGLPRFSLEDPCASGAPAMLMRCDTCSLLQVVV